MRMQVGRVAASVAVIAAVVSGCGGPGQPGAAVIIGADAVPLERVQSQVNTAIAKTDLYARFQAQGGTAADLSRNFVAGEVFHDLFTRRAERDGIVVTDAQIDAELDANGGAEETMAGSYFDMAGLRERVRDSLIALQIGQRVAPGLAVTADLVGAASREDAERAARALAEGGPEADALFEDESTARRGIQYTAASVPSGPASVLLAVPAGTVGFYQPDPRSASWNAFRVVDRRTDAAADPAALSTLGMAQLFEIGQREAQLDGERRGIEVNPRYGEWDPVQATVVPEGQQTGSVVLPSAAAAG